jgi:peptidyl-tRNA hydrolase
MRAIKTEAFIRLRVGISSETASGKIKKPQGEEKVIDVILGDFKKTEMAFNLSGWNRFLKCYRLQHSI